ncbi:unnamed protein product [Didymodactylos carnosus]|uniref:FYVE-type domain-containing protein n=1 Tax=Didymodactylos carnosus TaxID=1234261 RepID=A0A813UZM7_9BILA|nr:unnamed protein product [Didymodactylos carnosus]CAF0833876.1 unnamed protein product [Didymodactylos carnosus]CAF3561207.1 unnamed protein product [Didymodactylos carnosus]CAF3620988.1 unnamed protein product [Didymodactylos carnosus]
MNSLKIDKWSFFLFKNNISSTSKSDSGDDVTTIPSEQPPSPLILPIDNLTNKLSDETTSSLSSYPIAIVRLNSRCEKLKQQIQLLTNQLTESQITEKYAKDECAKYLQIYARNNERFITFERKQLAQMKTLLSILTPKQHNILAEISAQTHPVGTKATDDLPKRRAFTSPSGPYINPSLPISDPSSTLQITNDGQAIETGLAERTAKEEQDDDTKLLAARLHKSETDWEDLLYQITQIMDLSQNFCEKCSTYRDDNEKLRIASSQKQEENVKLIYDLSVAIAECEKQSQLRAHVEQQLHDANKLVEQLVSLFKKVEKNEADFRDTKTHYENLFIEQVNNVKKLVKERELLNLYIKRLETENHSLITINTEETTRILSHTTQCPTTIEESWGLLQKLREQLINQLKLEQKLRNDLQLLHNNYQADIREREQIENLLNRDLNTAKDEIIVLQSIQTEYERITGLKNNLEKQLEHKVIELNTTKTVSTTLTNQLKEKLELLDQTKSKTDEDNIALRIQLQKMKIDLDNSELVQRDFVRLSQSLQIQLENIRESEHVLRWHNEEDYHDCMNCKTPFTVTWRKHHCRHCGKVLCKDCTNKTVYTGPNNRASRVCDVCYTWLVKDSQPYFHSTVPEI